MFNSTHPGDSPHRAKRGVLGVLSALLLVVLAACGVAEAGTGGSSSSQSGKTDVAAAEADVAAAQERIAPYLTPVKKIDIDTPLTKKPEAGKVVTYIRYNNPTAAEYDPAIEAAAAALQWKVAISAVDGADPQSVSNAMVRAVSEGVDYIVLQGGDIAAMGQGLAEAKKARIPVFLAAGVGEPKGAENGIYGNVQVDGTPDGNLGVIDQAIIDSKGRGTILYANAPDFPVLAPLDDIVTKHVHDSCRGCTINKLSISAGDLGGDVASQVVNAIRHSPDTKYVVASFDTLTNGLPEALKAAGLDDVKIYISQPGAVAVKKIESGDFHAGLLTSNVNLPWLLFDQIARVSVGMDPQQKKHAKVSQQMWTTEDMPKGETSWTAPGYQDQYKKLWQIS
jgi:ABC-type sugar transport system substrate-binding protein